MQSSCCTRRFLACLVIAVQARSCLGDGESLFQAPEDAAHFHGWLAALKLWRAFVAKEINYTGHIYENPAVNWTRVSYVQPQTHLYDRYLYDPVLHNYTVDRYLADVERRYGGIDSILLWPTYTNIGIDARNQFDYFRALPGGLEGLRQLTAEFKSHGVRVLWAYNPWDQGTRSEGEPHWATLARLLKQTGGDGFNGDTMATMYKEFWDAGVAIDHPLVGEMEGGGYPNPYGYPQDRTWKSAEWTTMGWGERYPEGLTATALGVDKAKWLDSRHMTHVCDRWAKNRTNAMQFAFFNGIGYESWENVWGIFMHFTPRDGEALRRMATLLRWLGKQHFVQDYAEWEPYTPTLQRDPHRPFAAGGLLASKFVHHLGDCAWLVVNRAATDADAVIDTEGCGAYVYDLYRGFKFAGVKSAFVHVEANGFGVILATDRPDLPVEPLLKTMAALTARPLGSYSADWAPLQQEMVGMSSTRRYETPPPGTVKVPRASFRFRTAGVEVEGGCDTQRDTWGVCCPGRPTSTPLSCSVVGEDSRGVDAQFPWENVAGRFHDEVLELGPFYIDKYLVTKADYAGYLNATGYHPRDPYNFLVGWHGHSPPDGSEQEPVVWVSLREARDYCAWAGKRLPHTYEWQLAAQGLDGRLFPWGNETPDGRMPPEANGTQVPPLPKVDAFSPLGDSVYGVSGLVGHVWQYTDEFQDNHTRTVLLKGSSLYTPVLSSNFPAWNQNQNWYFPKAPELDRHGRMMLMDDSYERAGTLGFRCVADHADGQEAPYHYRLAHATTAATREDIAAKVFFA